MALQSVVNNICVQCVICKQVKQNENCVTLSNKGAATINETAIKQEDITRSVKEGDKVHASCRKRYCRSYYDHRLDKENQTEQWATTLASLTEQTETEDAFPFQDHCIFCASPVIQSSRSKFCSELHFFTQQKVPRIKTICETRNDEWGV